jgi:hypothetical protein
MEAKATKTKDGLLLSGQLPQELMEATAVEIYPLKDGAFLVGAKGFVHDALSKKSIVAAPTGKGTINEKEVDLLRKLLSIRFDQRVPAAVNKMLTDTEKKTLEALEEKGLVTVFKNAKYGKEGVYNISDYAFSQARDYPNQLVKPTAQPTTPAESIARLGFAVVESEGEARNLSSALSEKMKSGECIGLRAFDRKYYFISKSFLLENEGKALAALAKGDKTAEEISAETGLTPEASRALLLHLCESGDILEKARGKFAQA